MADNTDNGGSGFIKGILDLVGSTALGFATQGKSVIEEKALKAHQKEHQQDETQRALLSLANAAVSQGIDLGKAGITPETFTKAGLDPNASKALFGVYGSLGKMQKQHETEAQTFLQQMGLAAPAGIAPELVGPAAQSMVRTGEENVKFGHQQQLQQQKDVAAEHRVGEVQGAANAREASRESAALQRTELSNQSRLLAAHIAHPGTGGMKPENIAKFTQSLNAEYQKALTEQGADQGAAFQSMTNSILQSGLPFDYAMESVPFVIKNPGYFGSATPALGATQAFKLGIANDADKAALDKLANSTGPDGQRIGILKAATALAHAGKLDKQVYSSVVTRIFELEQQTSNRASSSTPAPIMSEDTDEDTDDGNE